LEPLLEALGELPVDVIQALFAALDPSLALRKFLGFAGLDPASDRARQFVALEDWLNDGVPLAAPVARECIGQWYGGGVAGPRARRPGGPAVFSPRRPHPPFSGLTPPDPRLPPP